MVMETRILCLLVILYGASVCHANTFEFVYNETRDDDPLTTKFNVTQVGSYATMGEWPHWCLGNISKCHEGIAIDLWVKFADVSENTPEIIVFSTGGHNWQSNGVYLLQRYGDEYEFGVAHYESVWTVDFRIIPNLWVNIRASWDSDNGLTVLVDGASYQNSDPSERDYQHLEFGAFLDTVVGVNMDGTPHTGDPRFVVARLSVSDFSVPLMRSELISEELLWIGCVSDMGAATTIPMTPTESPLSYCRTTCASSGFTLNALRDSQSCACINIDDLPTMVTDRSQCHESTDWNIYPASAVKNGQIEYQIQVTVSRLGDKSYVKPLESVLIHIETNFDVNVPFTVDFGDGTSMETTETELSYFWSNESPYDIVVTAEIGTTVITGTTSFTVENVDEGYEGDFVMLNAFHGGSSYLGNIDVTSIDHETRACDVSFGLGSNSTVVNLRGLDEYVVNEYIDNTFPNFGQYELTVDCVNNYGNIRNRTLFESKKMETTYHFQEVGKNFSTMMTGGQEFFRDLTITHNDPNISVPVHFQNSELIIEPPYVRLSENLIKYMYEESVIDSRILSVQNIVGQVFLNSSLVDGAWNLTTNITVSVPAGNNMFLNVSFGFGEDQTFYIHHLRYQSDVVFEVMFSTVRYYDILVNVSNDISSSTADMLVSVEVPIQTIDLNVMNITNKTHPIVLNIDLNDGIRGPMKVNFEIDYGNSLVKTYDHFSSSYFFATYVHEYIYPDWGNYDICVRAFNKISSVTKCIPVQVGERITYTDVQTPTDARFEINETAVFTIRTPKGSDKTFVVDFGDGETFVFTDNYLFANGYLQQEGSTIDPWLRTTPVSTIVTTNAYQSSTETNNGTNPTNGSESVNNETTTSQHGFNATSGNYSSTVEDTTEDTTMMTTSMETSTDSLTSQNPARRRRRSVNGTFVESASTDTLQTSNTDTSSGNETTAESGGTSDSDGVTSDSYNITGSETTTSAWSNQTAASNFTANGTSNTTADNTTDTSGLNTTIAATTTSSPVTTTTIITTTTTEPIPDDATNPFTSNHSEAVLRRDQTVIVTHRYQSIGLYSVRVKVANHFNHARDKLCPSVLVTDPTNDTCSPPALVIGQKYQSSRWNPLQFFRSDQINLTAAVTLNGCGADVPTFSWRTFEIIEEDGKKIERQFHGDRGICRLEDTERIFRYDRSSMPFGFYRVRLTVSPSTHPLQTTMHDFYMMVNPSAPHAVIDGNDEHMWFLVYGTTMIKFSDSIDPDFHSREGIEFDLVCMAESDLDVTSSLSRDDLISQSNLVKEGRTYKYDSQNRVRVFQYGTCFESGGNFTQKIYFPRGEFHVPSTAFVSSVSSFGIRLLVTKNNFTTSAVATFEIRLSNSSDLLSQLDDLLASKDTTGVMRAVEALSATLIVTPTNSSEDENFEAQEEMAKLKDKLIGALDSVSNGVKDIGQASGMLDLVGGLTQDSASVTDSARAGATSAIKNSASVTEEFADEPLDSLTDVGSKVVSGVSNVLPKKDETADKLAEHEKNIAAAEKDKKAVLGPTDEERENGEDEDGADITLDDETEDLTELTEEDLESTTPLPYNKLLKKCDLLHSSPLDKLYKYIFFFESIFRQEIKNKSVEIMVDKGILKLPRNDIFCYIGILEEPADVEWYYNRFFDNEKRRRDIIRRNADRSVSNSFLGAIDSVSSVLLNKTEGNQTVELNAVGLKVAMKKASPNDTSEDDTETMMLGGVKMPGSVLSESGNDTEVGQTMIVNENSPFTYANENDTTKIGTGVITFKLSTPGTKDQVPVSNTTEPIEIWLPGSPDLLPSPQLHQLILETGSRESIMNTHRVGLTKNDTTLHVIIRPQYSDSTDLFDVLIQYEGRPNDTHYLDMTTLPYEEDYFSGNLTWDHRDILRHTFYPDSNLTRLAGNYTIGVRLRSGQMDFQATETTFNYTFQVFIGGCRFWDDVNEGWSSDGCEVGNLTNPNATQCLCTHLTSFGGEMVVPPNTIDFSNVWAKFKSLNENAAVFSTVVSLLGLYVIGMIWARHMDKKDVVKWGATPLEDNLPTDNYHYQLSVSTGMKKGAGTTSNISLIISGEEADTGVRRLFDGKRKKHEKGSIMNYILSVEKRLGPLTFLRVWHDNSGKSKDRSWFLDQIEVTDLQNGERNFFLCNRWLACEEDDGMVDRILPAAGIEELVAFKQLFSSSVRKKLTSDHLWLSVFSRPTRSKFTRVQRISCCMSLLFLTMITNAMFFKGDSEGDTNQNQQVVSIKIGPISFTLQQIFISLVSTLIVFPPSFLLVTLFRRTKQKKNAIGQANQRLPKRGKWKNLGNNNSHSALWEMQPKKGSRLAKLRASIQALLSSNKSKYDASNDDDEEFSSIPEPTIAGDPDAHKKKSKKKKKPYMFPHWCTYIAWILCFFSVITPAFFTILYSMEWGKTKANEWLVTFVLSFFQSVIVVQPIKVLCLVAFIACVLKKPDLEEEGDCADELNNAIAAHDEEITTKGPEFIDEIAKRRKAANDAFEPPDTELLEKQRKARINELEMEAILKEICLYGFFVLVLFFLSYQQRDKQSYVYTENMKALFLGNGKFYSIGTVLDYWVWLQGTFLPTLYAAKYHNGTELFKWWDKRCLTDLSSRRMGIARMRQFRIKEDSCKIQPVMAPAINHCRDDYNWVDDDTKAYMPGWVKPNEENLTILEEIEDINPWIYANSVKLKSAPYVANLQTYKGGGYVVNFERSFRRTIKNLTRLRSEDWLDLRTRAVFLEFTVYNPNANLYASAILVTEFPAHGAAMARSEFKIFRLQSYVGGFAIVIILFEVLYCGFTLFFFYRTVKKVRKEKCKYFKTFWDILEFVMLCFAVACIVMYAFKHILTEVAMRSLKKQSKAEYVNFQSLAMYDEYFGYMTAIVVFLATLQFLKLLQFNKKMHMLGDTVKLATKDLKVYSICFMLYFLAFVVTFYLLFGKHMEAFNGFVKSAESTFAFTLGSFDFNAMSDSHKFLGPMMFFAFIMVIYVGLMSIFLTIIADAFNTVKENVQDAQNEYEMVDFVWRKFKGIIGVK